MKAQISNSTFDEKKSYSGVYHQQGRMLTDADWNELVDIIKRRQDAVINNSIGSGSPEKGGIFEPVKDNQGNITGARLRYGMLYVNGIRAELRPNNAEKQPSADNTSSDNDFDYTSQRDLSNPPRLPDSGEITPFIDVWERLIIWLEDDELRDPALHGSDTCVRTQTMAQLKWIKKGMDIHKFEKGESEFRIEENKSESNPGNPFYNEEKNGNGTGNHLFRLEIHDVKWSGNEVKELWLKWSFENGAETCPVSFLNKDYGWFTQGNWVYEPYSKETEQMMGYNNYSNYENGFKPRPEIVENLNTIKDKWVRRWDGYIVLEKKIDEGKWSPKKGKGFKGIKFRFIDENGNENDENGNPLVKIELDDYTIKLTLKPPYLVGDYWLARIRRQAETEEKRITPASVKPVGIIHHFLELPEIQVSQGENNLKFEYENFDDKTKRQLFFKPLTDLSADRIGFDSSTTPINSATNVQDALNAKVDRAGDVNMEGPFSMQGPLTVQNKVEINGNLGIGIVPVERIRLNAEIKGIGITAGQFKSLSSASNLSNLGINIGLKAEAQGSYRVHAKGIEAKVWGGGINEKIGISALAEGIGPKTAGYFEATYNKLFPTCGIHAVIKDEPNVDDFLGIFSIENFAGIFDGKVKVNDSLEINVQGGGIYPKVGISALAEGGGPKTAGYFEATSNQVFPTCGIYAVIKGEHGVDDFAGIFDGKVKVNGGLEIDKIKIGQGSPTTEGMVLTSDSAGIGTWQDPQAAGWVKKENIIIHTDVNIEKVGISTQVPQAKLQIGNFEEPVNLLLAGKNDKESSQLLFGKELREHPSGKFEFTGIGIRYDSTNKDMLCIDDINKNVPTSLLTIERITGNVGIGTQNPNKKLEIINGNDSQLRLTHTKDSKYVDMKVSTNNDLTITPSNKGKVIIDSQIKIKGGSPNEGKVIISDDTSGLAIWKDSKEIEGVKNNAVLIWLGW